MTLVVVRSRLAALAAVLTLASGLVDAQSAGRVTAIPDSVVEARTTALASTLRCPVCQGLSLQDSPSELAQQMRSLIKDQVAAGKSDAEVKDYFLSKYGEFILLEPRARGFNLLAYLLPAAVLVAGGLVVWWNVRRWTRPAEAGQPTGEPPAG